MSLRAAIYARVSTSSQNAAGQLAQLRDLAATRGYRIVQEYSEIESGAADHRPQLEQLIRDARRGRMDVALFWSLDRISRRGVADALATLERIRSAGVRFIFLQHPEIDTSSPWGDVILAVFAALAQMERDLLRERTRAGLARARREGKELGRPRRILRIDQAAEMRAAGQSYASIADELGVSEATVYRRLRNHIGQSGQADHGRNDHQAAAADPRQD